MKTQLKNDILLDANSMICGRLFDWVLEKIKKKQKKPERKKNNFQILEKSKRLQVLTVRFRRKKKK